MSLVTIPDRANATIIVTRDGIWPTLWAWTAKVPLVETGPGVHRVTSHRLHGDAFTKNAAFRNARYAVETMEVEG